MRQRIHGNTTSPILKHASLILRKIAYLSASYKQTKRKKIEKRAVTFTPLFYPIAQYACRKIQSFVIRICRCRKKYFSFVKGFVEKTVYLRKQINRNNILIKN